MGLKIKNRSQRYDINKTRSINGHKNTKYKMCPSIMMVICMKQHLRNIWSSIHENLTQNESTEPELKKKLLIKKVSNRHTGKSMALDAWSGCLDSGRLGSGHLGCGRLNAYTLTFGLGTPGRSTLGSWTLDNWTLGFWTLGLRTTRRLDPGCLDSTCKSLRITLIL